MGSSRGQSPHQGQGVGPQSQGFSLPGVQGSRLWFGSLPLQTPGPAVDIWEPQRGVRTVRNRREVGKVFPVTASLDILREAGPHTCPQLDPTKAAACRHSSNLRPKTSSPACTSPLTLCLHLHAPSRDLPCPPAAQSSVYSRSLPLKPCPTPAIVHVSCAAEGLDLKASLRACHSHRSPLRWPGTLRHRP